MHYIVVNIGCLECGVSTQVLGPYTSREEAESVADSQVDWREGGQSHSEVFELTGI